VLDWSTVARLWPRIVEGLDRLPSEARYWPAYERSRVKGRADVDAHGLVRPSSSPPS
jgi:hypothetical protein